MGSAAIEEVPRYADAMKNLPALRTVAIGLLSLLPAGCGSTGPEPGNPNQVAAQEFLDAYTAEFQGLYYASAEAEWASNTRIVEGDERNATRTRAANEAQSKDGPETLPRA